MEGVEREMALATVGTVEERAAEVKALQKKYEEEHKRVLKLRVHAANLEAYVQEQASLIDSLKYNVKQKQFFISYLLGRHRREVEALIQSTKGKGGDL